jgi:S1-C subfamily serine protease
MVNDHGQLVGVNVASGNEAQHYAIPVSTVNSVVSQLAQRKSVGWLGFGVSALPSQVADRWGINGGMALTAVVKDTPAEQSGLADYLAFATKEPFDYLIVLSVNDQAVTSMQSYVNVASQLTSGQQVTLKVGRFSPNGYYHGYRSFKLTVP